jgi:predicted secreted protein
MSNAHWAYGATFKWNNVAVAELTSIGLPQEAVAMLDVTSHDSAGGIRERIPTLIDPGTIPIAGNFHESDPATIAMRTDMLARTSRAFVVTFPAAMGTTFSGTAYMSNFQLGALAVDGSSTFTAELQVTGSSTLAITASNNLSALAGTESDGPDTALVFVPAFAAAKYAYNIAVNTASTTLHLTCTFAAGTATVWIGGVLIETLVSTVESGHIAIGAADTVTAVTIRVQETNKTAKEYVLSIARP